MQDSLPEPSYDDSAEADKLSAAMELASTAGRWFTAVLSLGLVVTIIFWAYRVGVRDASELPVIQAMNEPARTRPEDPGGTVADNQGLEVNEVLAGEEASIPSESQTAPPSVALIDEDIPSVEDDDAISFVNTPQNGESNPETVLDPNPDTPDEVNPQPDTQPAVAVATEPPPTVEDQEQAAREQAAREQAAQEQAARERAAQEQAAREQAAQEQAAREQAAQEQNNEEQAARDEEARKIQEALEAALREEEAERQANTPNPNLRVQLGSFDSEIAALGFLDTLSSRHGDLLASRRISVQKVTTGTQVIFRIRASGFSQEDDTNALCQALRARGVDCVPVGG